MSVSIDKFRVNAIIITVGSGVAQSAEQRTVNPLVAGSSPASGAIFLFCHVKNKEPPLIRGLFVITFIGREWFILFGQVHGPA